MKSSTRLDSIVFELTPTRTRCNLVINANAKSEKIASGLLNPFLAHLRAAQEQIGKGGYSIVLEPKRGGDSAWFTKGTVERFVRFVSTPEILERVSTIESEILQIEKAITIQIISDNGSHIVEDLPAKFEESAEGRKSAPNGNEEKAIVLYQPTSHQAEEDSSNSQEKNSKVQLVQVLETRKTVLQKEQGMAFARAVAAGFDIDNIAALNLFAECFGASRMMDACKRFEELWKAKHESGQWVDVEATEALSCKSDLPAMNASGIMFLGSNEKGEFRGQWPHGEVASEKNGISFVTGADGKPEADHQGQPSVKEHVPGQFPHPMFPAWQMHSQANGLPVFHPYPMPGMPYYQNYPVNGPFFQQPYPSVDDSVLYSGQRARQRRHSMDSRDLSAEFETQDTDASGRRTSDDDDNDEDSSVRQRSRKKGNKFSGKQSGTVLIHNINYIASAKQRSSDSDAESSSSGTDDEERDVKSDEVRKSKKKGANGEADDGHWQAFQNFLLKDADESNSSARSNMFAMEGKGQGRKRQGAAVDASSMLGERNMGGNQDVDFSNRHDLVGDMTCSRKPIDEQMIDYGREGNCADDRSDLEFIEAGGRRGAYRRSADANIDSMISQREKLTDVWDSSLDPVITKGFQFSSDSSNRNPSHDMADASLVILHKSRSLEQAPQEGRTALDMDYELPSGRRKSEHHTVGPNYEPNDLNLMPDRVEHGACGYDPALDYEMEAQVSDAAKVGAKKKEVATDAKGGPKKGVKDQKLKAEKRIVKPSKFSPSEDARACAEKLRAFKADLQKLKKEKEEEQKKRIEALKLERQKRIAARSGANPPHSPLPSQQARKQLPRLSPVSQKGSKFSDTEPGSSSPLQRSTLKTISKASPASSKASKSGRLNDGSQTNGNRLTRSASSLSVRKEQNNALTPESKATIARIRRLSEPKGTAHQTSSQTRSVDAVSKRRLSVASEMKKGVEMKRMSATASLDKTKSGTLPGSKMRTSKISAISSQKKSTKGILQKPNDKPISGSHPITDLTRGDGSISSLIDGDDTTVVEKTVVMLECEKPSVPVARASEVKASVQGLQPDPYSPGCKSEDNIAIPLPASPITVKEVDEPLSRGHVKGTSNSLVIEERATDVEEVSPNTSSIVPTEEPYRAPYARVSSVEDPCMTKSDYGRAPPTETSMAHSETATAHVSDDQEPELVKISEVTSVKLQGKESSKGFRRLLKFGKKGSAASESNAESDKVSLDGSVTDKDTLNSSSKEVFTLKNLLTQEGSSSVGTTPKKSSRSFSLLSPFRSKTVEKKTTT